MALSTTLQNLARTLGQKGGRGENVTSQVNNALAGITVKKDKDRFLELYQKALASSAKAAPKATRQAAGTATAGEYVGAAAGAALGGMPATAAKVAAIGTVISKLDTAFSQTKLGDKFEKTFGQSAAKSVLNTAQNFEALRVNFERATTGGSKFAGGLDKVIGSVFGLAQETSNLRIYLDQVGASALSVAESSTAKLAPGFDKALIPLAKTAAELGAFNVSGETSVGILNRMQSQLGMTANESYRATNQLVSFAARTNQAVSVVAADYNRTISSFMDILDPSRMDRTFQMFQVRARRMNMEASQLYDMARKFDTIESANMIGGRLNTVFSAIGVEFNGLALQDMSMSERIDYISKKTRQAFNVIKRDFGAQEGRLLTQSIADKLTQGNVAELRAFAVEGGPGRATGTEARLRAGQGAAPLSEEEKRTLIIRRQSVLQQLQAAKKFGEVVAATTLLQKANIDLTNLMTKLATDTSDLDRNLVTKVGELNRTFKDMSDKLMRTPLGDPERAGIKRALGVDIQTIGGAFGQIAIHVGNLEASLKRAATHAATIANRGP